jgi:uncharacterized protein YutE (UPF0331/DUF86 family)
MPSLNGVLQRKLATFASVLGELRSIGTVTRDMLQSSWQLRRAVERDLQILGEIMVDLCQRLISLHGESPAMTGKEAIDRCVAIGALSSAETFGRIVQFRNFIVHRYEDIDLDILVEILNHRLDAFHAFRVEIQAYAIR